jgi:hypothetical protein
MQFAVWRMTIELNRVLPLSENIPYWISINWFLPLRVWRTHENLFPAACRDRDVARRSFKWMYFLLGLGAASFATAALLGRS